MIIKITPDGFISQLESKLKAADYPFGLRTGGWVGVMIVFYIAIPAVFIFRISNTLMPFISKIMLSLIIIIISVLIPSTLLKGRINTRKRKMTFELPDILDLMTVSVEAGLGFDAALGKITETAKGELVKELQITIREIQLGKSRREALTHMSKRCDIPDISNFVTSFVQADQLGVSIGRILRVQADQMRDKRKQRAREQAMKAPVKMLIPMVFFIFPTIFVVILGPAMIQISKVLFKR
jgi:tight adherence protein C